MSENKNNKKTATKSVVLWGLTLSTMVVVVILSAYYFSESDKKSGAISTSLSAGDRLIRQATEVRRGFERMLSLGYKPEEITYGDGGRGDLIGSRGVLQRQKISDGVLTSDSQAHWRLLKGQIIGAYSAETPDIILSLSDIRLETCQQVNNKLWNDADTEPPRPTGLTLLAFESGEANLLQLFNDKSRTEACVMLQDGSYLYYRVVARR